MDSRDHAAHRVEQQLRLALRQPSAKDDQVRVKNGHEVRHRHANHGEGLFEDGAGLAVSLARRLKDEPGIALFSQARALSFGGRAEDFAASGGNPLARDLAFKVADFAEVLIPARPLEIETVELPGVPGAAAVELAIDENARADAGAERDKHEAARVARHAAPVLADCRHVAG